MTHHSSTEVDPKPQTEVDLPLSDRPLVARDQNTVVASAAAAAADGSETQPQLQLTATAQQIHDRLFSGTAPEMAGPELVIGHFRVEERIGAGGMGAVFRALDTELTRPVALKVLHPNIAADSSLVARFRKEARAAAQLSHDNIARVFLSGEQDGVYFIAYEFADGQNLRELITARGRVTVEDAINYAIQMTFALNHMHTKNIVHRDIKPSNIILTKTGRIKVVDLGLARRETTDSIGDLTVAGTTLGTFDYISPEQARDPSSADIRSDIYSLGCSLYHMLTGQPPYPEGTALQKLLDHQGKEPPNPATISSDVPADLAFIVQKMMHTDAEQRYQDPGQLLTDLIAIASETGLRSVPAEGVVWRRVPARRVRDVSGSLFLALAIGMICVTSMVMHFSPQPHVNMQDVYGSLKPPGAAALTESVASDTTPGSVAGNQEESSSSESPLRVEEDDPAKIVDGSADSENVVPLAPADPFVLQKADGGEKPFRVLAKAWSEARSGDVILLNFDGVAESPIQKLSRPLDSGSIEIRAAAGRRPLLDFRIDEVNPEGQLFYLASHLTLSITGVDIRLTIAEDARYDVLSLFECVGENRVSLRDTTIEVINPGRHEVSVVRLVDAAMDSSAFPVASCRMENVAVRGTCDIVYISGLTPFRFDASESGFALDGSLVNNRGSDEVARASGTVDVLLTHTSSILARAAFRMEDSDGLSGGSPERTLSPLSVTADSNVFISLPPEPALVLSPERSLVQSLGNASVQDLEDLLTWNGDFNLYHNFATWWELKSATFDIESTLLDFDEWQDHWLRIAGTSETHAAEFDITALRYADELTKRSRRELSSLPTRAFQLQRQLFFPTESTSALVPNAVGRVPGVDQLLAFPDAEVMTPSISSRAAAAAAASGDAR